MPSQSINYFGQVVLTNTTVLLQMFLFLLKEGIIIKDEWKNISCMQSRLDCGDKSSPCSPKQNVVIISRCFGLSPSSVKM